MLKRFDILSYIDNIVSVLIDTGEARHELSREARLDRARHGGGGFRRLFRPVRPGCDVGRPDRSGGRRGGSPRRLAIATIAVAAAEPEDARAPYDERERLIDLAAARAGFYVVQAGAFLAISALALGWPAVSVINLLLGAMVAGEIAKDAWRVATYRRGAA
jgi:hypothetical protein